MNQKMGHPKYANKGLSDQFPHFPEQFTAPLLPYTAPTMTEKGRE